MSRTKIIRKETKDSCGIIRVNFPKNCSMPYLVVSFATEIEENPLQDEVSYGIRSIEPPGDYIGFMSYPLIVEALELVHEYVTNNDDYKDF